MTDRLEQVARSVYDAHRDIDRTGNEIPWSRASAETKRIARLRARAVLALIDKTRKMADGKM